jgi:hypothetical protein
MPGEYWTSARQSKAQWVGNPVAKVIGGNLDDAAKLVAAWIHNQVLVESAYHSPKRRKSISCVSLNENKAIEILGPLYAMPDPE